MGKMLESLKLGDARRANLALAVAVPATVPPPETPGPDCVVDWEIGDEVPFIEVGGVKSAEATANLRGEHPPQPAQRPHLAVDMTFSQAAPLRAVRFTEAKPMSAAFEPWQEAPPAVSIAPEMITYHQPDHAASQEYATLLSTIRDGLKLAPPHVLMMVGIKAHIGTTTVLLNLAGVAARQKQAIAIIDVSGRKPGLAQRLGCTTTFGLEEVIDGAMALDQALVQTAIPELHLLAAGSPSKKQSAVTLEAMAWLMPLIRQRFDLILIDGPPLEHTAELAVHVPHAHGTFLVLPHGEPAVPFKGIAKVIGRLGGRLNGLVHTHFEG